MRKKRRSYLGLILLATVGLGVFAYYTMNRKEPQVTYLTEPARIGTIRRTVNATGQIDPVQLVNVGAQVSGQIERLHVTLGQDVKKGDLIAEIDSTTQANDLATNKARLASYEAQLVSRQIALRVARANYDRELQLQKTDSTSKKNLDDAESAWATANAAVKELESQIVQTEIAVDTNETNLGYTRITAPLDGTIVSVPVEEGQTVNANQTTPTIVQIADLTQMEIKIEIAEGDITKVRPGLPVEYSILSEPGMTFTTELHTIDPGLTTLSDGTYESSASSSNAIYYYAKALVDNSHGRLRIGMTTQNVIAIEEARDVLMIPNLAIQRVPGSPHGASSGGSGRTGMDPGALSVQTSSTGFVRILMPGGGVEDRTVELGLADNMHTQVLSGVREGEAIITTEMSSGEPLPSGSGMRGPGIRR